MMSAVGDGLEELTRIFPTVFESEEKYGQGEALRRMHVTALDIDWTLHVERIPLTNSGVVYDTGDVSEVEKAGFLEDLVSKGVIREMQPHEKVF